jgi:hypothetical protein
MKEILLMLHYCVCDFLRKGPYKRLALPFGGVSHASKVMTFVILHFKIREFMW